MRRHVALLLAASVIGLVGLAGCNHCCRRAGYAASAPPCCDPVPAARFRPLHALAPRRSDPLPIVPPTRTDVVGPPAATLPGLPPSEFRGYEPSPVPAPSEPAWKPSPEARPSPSTPPANDNGTRLYPPESTEPPVQPSPPSQTKPAPIERKTVPSPPLPVGIKQFAPVRNRVSSGLWPSLEGLDWLKENQYRTIVCIRSPGETDAADRRLVEERRGMKFVSIELSPQTVRESIDQFNHILSEASALPVFVYDKKDGALQGYLWYLHFRIVDVADHDDARIRAGSLGLKQQAGDEEMWQAIQKYLSVK